MDKNFSFKHIFTVGEHPVYYLIDSYEISDLASLLIHENVLAIDQERAPHNKFYFQKPSLIQISTRKDIYLIDVLKDTNVLEPLNHVLSTPSIVKVFVDASSDLYYFQKYFNIAIKGVFDILIANNLCYPRSNTTPGLPDLVQKVLKIKRFSKSKREQKSDWTIRPLSTAQLRYASNEISVFIPLYDAFIKVLTEKNLIPFSNYANKRLEAEIPDLDYNPLNVRRIKGFDNLSNYQKNRAIQLGIIRDKIARKRNKPFYYVFSNVQLLKLAKNTNIKPKDLFTRNQRFSQNEMIVLQQALDDPSNDTPIEDQTKQISFTDLPLLQQKLLLWRNQVSNEFHIPKRFILSNEEIKLLDYSTKETLLRNMWFSHQNNKICNQLTSILTKNLGS